MHTRAHKNTHTHTHTHAPKNTCAHTHKNTQTHIHTQTRAPKHKFAHTNTHTYTHTKTLNCSHTVDFLTDTSHNSNITTTNYTINIICTHLGKVREPSPSSLGDPDGPFHFMSHRSERLQSAEWSWHYCFLDRNHFVQPFVLISVGLTDSWIPLVQIALILLGNSWFSPRGNYLLDAGLVQFVIYASRVQNTCGSLLFNCIFYQTVHILMLNTAIMTF